MLGWATSLQRWHAGALAEAALEAARRRVDLSELELELLPPALVHLQPAERLAKLFLHANRLRELRAPSWPSLTVLTLDYNRLDELPQLHQLPHLRYLNVSHNPLGRLPAHIGQLVSLQTLWCNCTELQALPEELCQLTGLEVFGARKNKIKRLPTGFAKLTKLSWVTLQDNLIEELPEGLSSLEIIHLNLSMNRLRELPEDLVKYKELQFFKANNNQIDRLLFGMSDVWNLSEMENIVCIDLCDNPIVENSHYVKCFKKYPVFKISNVEKEPSEIVEDLITDQINAGANFDTIEAEEDPGQDNIDDDSDSSIFEDWEHSICSNHLNFEEQSADDLEDNEINGINISVISKFAGTGS